MSNIANIPPRKTPRKSPHTATQRDRRIDAYMASHKKSLLLAFVLAFFFGPIGFLYASIAGGIALILLTLAMFAMPELALITWVAAWIGAPFVAHNTNKKRRTEAELMAGPIGE